MSVQTRPWQGREKRRSHVESFSQAVRRGLTPGKPFQQPLKMLRLAVGMFMVTVLLSTIHDLAEQMVIVLGAFMTSIACIMPYNRGRIQSAIITVLAMIGAIALGASIGPQWEIVLPILFFGFFVAGLLRAVAVGLAMRTLFVLIMFIAFCEITPSLPISEARITGLFAVGSLVMLAGQLLPPWEGKNTAQRQAVAALYRSIVNGSGVSSALLAADRSVGVLHFQNSRGQMRHFAALTSLGEQIGHCLVVLENQADADSAKWIEVAHQRLQAIANSLEDPKAQVSMVPWPAEDPTPVQAKLIDLCERCDLALAGKDVRISQARRMPDIFELLRNELGSLDSPYLQHGLRLGAMSVLCMLVGLWMGSHLPPDLALPAHGFWVVVAGVLITSPDYGSTFSRGVGRTVGTVAGAALGVGLAALNLPQHIHIWVLFVLYLGYLAFRGSGQPFSMIFIVSWIAGLLPGISGALTRGLDTIAGCIVAFVFFLLAPTWQSRQIGTRLRRTLRAQAVWLQALQLHWKYSDSHTADAVRQASTAAQIAATEMVTISRNAAVEPGHFQDPWTPSTLTELGGTITDLNHQIGALGAISHEASFANNTAELLEKVWYAETVADPSVLNGCAEVIERLREVTRSCG